MLPLLAFTTWQQAGTYKDAETLWRATLARNPDCWMAHSNLGILLGRDGHVEEAIEHYQRSIQIKPDYSDAMFNLGATFANAGQFDEAIEPYRKGLQINPNNYQAQRNLGSVLRAKGSRFEEAIEYYRAALQIKPDDCDSLNNLGVTLVNEGRFDEGIDTYHKCLQINTNFSAALNNLAWVLATGSKAELRDGTQAAQLAERACELTHYGNCLLIGTLAAAYAESGRFPEAVATAEKAERLAADASTAGEAAKNRELLELNRRGKPYHEPPPKP